MEQQQQQLRQQASLEYLCRVCAANTKGKNSVAECVYVLKTPELKDKLEKYLCLTISEQDLMPKVLCKTCFRQVEATASLSKIAKHTQRVFRDFLFSKLKPNSLADLNYENDSNAAEFTTTTMTPNNELQKTPPPIEVPITAPVTASAAPEVPESTVPPKPNALPKDEVIVNVSVNDPLTRETQQKMISASQKRQSSLDARFTPRSIAQRAFSSTPKQTGDSSANSSSNNSSATAKKSSPPGVINFFKTGAQQVTSYSSGGYVIGRAAGGKDTAGVIKEASELLQQKRKNLKMALNSIKTANTGQVSLLKASQKPPVSAMPAPATPAPVATATPTSHESRPQRKPQRRATICHEDDTTIEALPERMIIAAAKHQKQQQMKLQKQQQQEQQQQQQKQKQKQQSPPTAKQLIEPEQESPQDLSQSAKSNLPEDILLGKVIKDTDLLKLILKALKWPVTKQTMETQMTRLKNSKFATIMSDPHLLQDTDLTQILGPYLAPVLLAAQAIQQQQIAALTAVAFTQLTGAGQLPNAVELPPSPATATATAAGLATAIPYKLPAETSVQLVPANPEDLSAKAPTKRDSRTSLLKNQPAKKRRKTSAPPKTRDGSIVISDEEAENEEKAAKKASGDKATHAVSTFSADPETAALLAQFELFPTLSSSNGETNGSSSVSVSTSEALMTLLQRQRAMLHRMQRPARRKRNNSIITVPASSFELGFDEDDIVLMEQSIVDQTQALEAASHPTVSSSSTPAFVMPQKTVAAPVITRPIIKRRKTVIQASPAVADLSSLLKTAPTFEAATVTATSKSSGGLSPVAAATTTNLLPPMPPLQKKPASTSATATTITDSSSTKTSTSAQTIPVKPYTKKVSGSKSALGQQLLEAIGLQKISDNSKGDGVRPHESIEQIRSALKKSLQKAQEQQQLLQRKLAEPIIQDADSTTKSVVKEVFMEAKTAGDASNAHLDLEEQIDKVTLVVQNKKKAAKEIIDMSKHCNDDGEKKLRALTKPTNARRKPASATIHRGRKTIVCNADADKEDLRTIAELKASLQAQNKEKEKERTKAKERANEQVFYFWDNFEIKDNRDNLNLSASSAGSVANTESVTSHETDISKHTDNAPRKRGRKAKAEKYEKYDEINEFNEKLPAESDPNSRPTRHSKTMSKYYKGPQTPTRRGVPVRSTRNRT